MVSSKVVRAILKPVVDKLDEAVTWGKALFKASEPVAEVSVEAPEVITLYRGTQNGEEIRIQSETGWVLSDAARLEYQELIRSPNPPTSLAAINNALETAREQDIKAIEIWGSEDDYVQAHAAWGHEIEKVSGPRTKISWTSDLQTAQRYAAENPRAEGVVFKTEVPKSEVLPSLILVPKPRFVRSEKEICRLQALRNGGMSECCRSAGRCGMCLSLQMMSGTSC